MTNTENWKPVVGYEGAYEVSDLGRVRSLPRVSSVASRWGGYVERRYRGKLLRATVSSNGYLQVTLCDEGLHSGRLVHRLVAEAFVPAAAGKDFVNHKDGVKTNNPARNLEWVTRSENMQHAHDTGLAASPKVAVVGTHTRTGVEVHFECQMDAEIALSATGRASSAVHHCLTGKKKTAYGYRWRHA